MKKNVWNRMRLFALAGVMSLTLLACGGTDDAKEELPVQQEQQEENLENPDAKYKEVSENNEEPSDNPEENTNTAKQGDGTGAQDGEDPIGEITDLGDGQFTIKKFYQETGEDGSMIMGSPAEGSEGDGGMEFDSLTVLCDETTHIYKRTIRDGGASYEDSESSFEKLEKGMEVSLKGNYEGDAYRATEVQIVEVILK